MSVTNRNAWWIQTYSWGIFVLCFIGVPKITLADYKLFVEETSTEVVLTVRDLSSHPAPFISAVQASERTFQDPNGLRINGDTIASHFTGQFHETTFTLERNRAFQNVIDIFFRAAVLRDGGDEVELTDEKRYQTEGPLQNTNIRISGTQQQWHRVTFTVEGPAAAERGSTNPFLNYRFTVLVSKDGVTYTVPGYFAADGTAAQSGSDAGNKFRAHFSAPEEGLYHFRTDFREGERVAIRYAQAGTPVPGPHGIEGTFYVGETQKTGKDFRAKGKGRIISPTGDYFVYEESNKVFFPIATNSPESILGAITTDSATGLAIPEFDNTPMGGSRVNPNFDSHKRDFREGKDPTWGNGRGKGVVGAINFLSNQGINGLYTVAYSTDRGDAKTSFPWNHESLKEVYDVSKLEQWLLLFEHANSRGVYIYFQPDELENYHMLQGDVRKLWERMIVAVFGHLPGFFYGLGEETRRTITELESSINHIRSIHPYESPVILIHNPVNDFSRYSAHGVSGLSLQEDAAAAPLVMRNRKMEYPNLPLLATELGPDATGTTRNGNRTDRAQWIYAALLQKLAGTEFYFGYNDPCDDLHCGDLRTHNQLWSRARIASDVVLSNIDLSTARNARDLFNAANREPGDSNYLLLSRDEHILVGYLGDGGSVELQIPREGRYHVDWIDPGNGQLLQSELLDTSNGYLTLHSPQGSTVDKAFVLRRENSNARLNWPDENGWAFGNPRDYCFDETTLANNIRSLDIPSGWPMLLAANGKIIYFSGDITSSTTPMWSITKLYSALFSAFVKQHGGFNNINELIPLGEMPSSNYTTPATHREILSMQSDICANPGRPGEFLAYNNEAYDLYARTYLGPTFFGTSNMLEILERSFLPFIGHNDPIGIATNHGGGWAGGFTVSAEDLARLGLVLTRNGEWDGTQVFAPDFIQNMQSNQLGSGIQVRPGGAAGNQCNQDGPTDSIIGDNFYGMSVWKANSAASAFGISGLAGKTLLWSRDLRCNGEDVEIVYVSLAHRRSGTEPSLSEYYQALVNSMF